MSYLDLVEEYPKEYKYTLFEKILMAAKRAKDLHKGYDPLVTSPHKDSYVALEEANMEMIEIIYREPAVDERRSRLDEDEGEDL